MAYKRYIDFYQDNKVIPVNQEIASLEEHYQRRYGLYKQLGLNPCWIKGKSVLEFGPGTGDNAMFTATMLPAKYVLVDANSYSIDSIAGKLDSGALDSSSVELIHSDMLQFEEFKKFDLVLCEGMLEGQENSPDYLRHAAKHVCKGGMLVITTCDYVSAFADVCRRLVYPIFHTVEDDDALLLDELEKYFLPDLSCLTNMSKNKRDWVIDQILHPWADDQFMSFGEAISALDSEFDFHGSSPGFVEDWRWYKSLIDPDLGINQLAIDQYMDNTLNFFDFRCLPVNQKAPDREKNRELYELCKLAFYANLRAWREGRERDIMEFLHIAKEISGLIEGELPETHKSLVSYNQGIMQLLDGNFKNTMSDFWGFFGRSQQYVSFTRKYTFD